jgi:hypothetical protein
MAEAATWIGGGLVLLVGVAGLLALLLSPASNPK